LNAPNNINVALAPASASGAPGNQPPSDALPVRLFAWVGRFVLKSISLIPTQAGINLAFWLTLMVIGTAEARKWSEPVQMTHAGEMQLSGQFFGAAVDSRDVIHVSYYVNYGNVEGQPDRQVVYQQFDKQGQALMNPLMIGTVFPIEESIQTPGYSYDLYLDSDENVHLLWGGDTLCHSMFNREGEHIISSRLEGLLMPGGTDLEGIPHAVVDLQDRLVVVARTCTYYDVERQWQDYFVSYGRWTYEGDLIDTLHVLAESSLNQDPQICISEGDTLHFSWNVNPNSEAWWYAKVGPNDEQVIGPVELFEPTEDEYRLGSWNFLVDEQGRIYFRAYVRSNGRRDLTDHLIQYLPNLEVGFDRVIDGEGYGGVWGSICFGLNREILMASIRVFSFGDYAIAFAGFSPDGEYIDSLQFPESGILTNQMRPLMFSDSSVAVIWTIAEREAELFMRYSLPPSEIRDRDLVTQPESSQFYTAYPIPFNSTLTIKYTVGAGHAVLLHLSIYDISGREVFTAVTAPNSSGKITPPLNKQDQPNPLATPYHGVAPAIAGGDFRTLVWDASSSPAGVYFVKVQTGEEVATKKVVLMR